MSKRPFHQAGGFWKPKSSSQNERDTSKDNANNDSTSSYVFNFNKSPLHLQKQTLPITKHKRQILYAMEHYSILIIVGETGSGKSTQIPQFLYENGWCTNHENNKGYSIVCTQPRRLAVQTLAQRVSKEMGCRTIGDVVGYKVRFDHVATSSTCIHYVTDGTLIREAMLHDPLLSQYSVIMIDEAHERNLNTDVVLGIVKKIYKKRKKDLRIIICSATIDAQAFLDFFISPNSSSSSSSLRKEEELNTKQTRRKRRWGDIGQNDNDKKLHEYNAHGKGTIISIDGRQHPVDILYAKEPVADYIKGTVDAALKIHFDLLDDDGGDILCFLPTGEDIDRAIHYANESIMTKQQRQDVNDKPIALLPLYGTLPYHMQARVFQPKVASDTTRRVIFATNIAETSVTVPHVSSVIDCGYVKLPFYDTDTGFNRLVISPISMASAKQRSGRAGRLKPGKCYRLYTEAEMMNRMQTNTIPEILRTNLSSFLLTLKALGVHNILAFDLMTLPSVPALCQGLETLYVLGAIDEKTNLTSVGSIMAEFPTEPQVSKMLLESLSNNCSKEILCVAAAQQVRSLFYQPRTAKQNMDFDTAVRDIVDNKSDHVTYVRLMQMNDTTPLNENDCKEYFINYNALRRANEIRKQLTKCIRKYGPVKGLDDEGYRGEDEISACIRKCITGGYFSNTAKLGNDGRYYSLRGNHMLSVSPTSMFQRFGLTSEYILFGETYDGRRGGIEVNFVSAIEGNWLREIAPHYWD